MKQIKKIVFLTGTRADFGKLKSLIEILYNNPAFEVHIFATGMHMDVKYGHTVNEIEKSGYNNIYKYISYSGEAQMDITLARTVEGFANYVRTIKPDLVVVHGDRVEALAGATVGALNNILVAHVEGGELSGTVDELIRHAVTKLSHIHFVANEEAEKRLQQLGETDKSIFVIGSPDMDVMLSQKLFVWEVVRDYYDIPFNDFAISIFHPVTTEFDCMASYASNYATALEASGCNYIMVYPNNDKGSDIILSQLKKLNGNKRFKLFPSVRFENFLVMMKEAKFIIGNSSAGLREAPCYGIPTVNVGTRQQRRSSNTDIINCSYATEDILKSIRQALHKKPEAKQLFGNGSSDVKFLQALQSKDFWQTSKQKSFNDR